MESVHLHNPTWSRETKVPWLALQTNPAAFPGRVQCRDLGGLCRRSLLLVAAAQTHGGRELSSSGQGQGLKPEVGGLASHSLWRPGDPRETRGEWLFHMSFHGNWVRPYLLFSASGQAPPPTPFCSVRRRATFQTEACSKFPSNTSCNMRRLG